MIPHAKVVKALNIINATLMVDPASYLSENQVPTMWIAGSIPSKYNPYLLDDDDSCKRVTAFLNSIGWPDVVVARDGIKGSRLLEPLAMLWIDFGVRKNSWLGHGFKLIHA